MKDFVVFLIMNSDGKFWGKGGWVDDEKDATMFNASDALLMVRAIANTSAVRALVTGYAPERLTADPRFSSSLATVA